MGKEPKFTDEQVSFVRSCREDPAFFFNKVLRWKPYDKQIEIAQAVYDHNRVYVPACHASGKSAVSGALIVQFLYTHKNSIAIWTAPTGRQVKKVLGGEVRSHWKRAPFKLEGELLAQEIRIDDQWYAMGFSTDEPEKFQGIHSPSGWILVIADEAAGLPPEIHDAMEGIMTGRNAYMLQIANPTVASGPFHKGCTSGVGKVIPISYTDTPNIKAGKILYDGLITQDWVDEKEKLWGGDSPLFKSRVLGEFPDEGEDTLMPISWIMSGVKAEGEARGVKRMGVDVARFGRDLSVVVIRQGPEVIGIYSWSGRDTMETTGRVISLMQKHNVVARNVWVDDGGLGGGVVDRLRELKHQVHSVAFGARSANPFRFQDWRAEAFWNLRVEFERNYKRNSDTPPIISIPDHPRLISDLSNMRYDFKSDGTIFILSKSKMKKMGLDSTDFADALILASQGEYQDAPRENITGDMIQKAIWQEVMPDNILRKKLLEKKRWTGIQCH